MYKTVVEMNIKHQKYHRVLVTGGAGFIGSNLCDRLIKEGNDVICLDNYFTGSKDNVRHLLDNKHFELVRHDVTEPYYAEVDCDKLLALPLKTFKVKKISKFPIVERDLAIVVDEKVTVGSLEEIIKQCCGKNYNDVKLFDIYRSEQLGDKKSLAFRIKLLSDEKTLSEEDITKVIDKILRRTNELYGAVLR